MAGIPIPPEMLPRMDWHAEDKSAAWEHFTTRLKLYYTVGSHTKGGASRYNSPLCGHRSN